MLKIFGFTLIRNGVKYDYAFEECLKSLLLVCEKVYIAVGESDDGTLEKVQAIEGVEVIPTVWDDNLREGGLILSQQTNVALEKLREDHGDDPDAWGVYLQGDEAIHEQEAEKIKYDVKSAHESGHDVVRFRYLHFWQSHYKIAINKKWYPQEIRALRLNTKVRSWGDAQSFENFEKPFNSDAHVYHYGHVREDEKYQLKKTDFLKLYHLENKISKYRKREKRFDDQTECLNFYGSHPSVLHERINRIEPKKTHTPRNHICIVGNPNNYSEQVKSSIVADKIDWVPTISKATTSDKQSIIILEPSWLQKCWYASKAPRQMRSKLARPWTNDFYLKIKLFEKQVWVK